MGVMVTSQKRVICVVDYVAVLLITTWRLRCSLLVA